MKKTTKTEIKAAVEKTITEVVQNLKIEKPSKKTRKAISKFSKALRTDLKAEMKRQLKTTMSASKVTNEKKAVAA